MTRLVALVVALGACGSSTTPAPATDRPAPATPAALLVPPVGKLAITDEWVGPTKAFRAVGKAVPVDQLRQVTEALGLPVSGTADIDIALEVPNGSAAQIVGHARVACTKCRIGDDSHLDFDRIDVALDVANGRAEITRWKVESPDLELELSGHVELASALGSSQVTGCVRFRPSEALRTGNPKTFALFSVTGAPLGDDGFYSIALEGTIDAMKRLGKVCH